MKTKNRYGLPIDKGYIIRESKMDSHAHKIYPHSVDYILPIGTPVKAAAGGIVIDVKDDSDKCGRSRKYERHENYVEIRHGDEYSYYGHIKKGSAKVKIGDRVKKGQVIALSGKTGWMANLKEDDWPHLHFMVGTYEEYKTLEIRFEK